MSIIISASFFAFFRYFCYIAGMAKFITEITESDFRRLNRTGFELIHEHIRHDTGGYSRYTLSEISLNEVLSAKLHISNIAELDSPIIVVIKSGSCEVNANKQFGICEQPNLQAFYDTDKFTDKRYNYRIIIGVDNIRHTNKFRNIRYSVPGIKLKDSIKISKDDTEAIYLIHPDKQNNQL